MTQLAASNLFGMTHPELKEFALAAGQPRYRGGQLYRAMYSRQETDFTTFTDLDKDFRAFLTAHHKILYPEIQAKFISRDGSVRYLLRLEDGQTVEAVFMPTTECDSNRVTFCISSQVGCAVDCRFCFTGLLGVKRNLTVGEIAGQVFALLRAQRPAVEAGSESAPRRNVVFMGMGEPLLNLGPVMKAVQILADPVGAGIPLRRITVSTSGIVPRILELARLPVRPKLAVSLNASTDEQRSALMPLNRKYPLQELMAACREYPLRPRERLTFEYVLLDGINDSDADAARVAELLSGLRAKVNLIPYNSGSELPFRPSPLARVLAFQQELVERRVPAFIRISRGQDIMAACGQLSLASAPLDQSPPLTPA